ncbi:hypothetical protein D9M71_726060 [compost metagenome]
MPKVKWGMIALIAVSVSTAFFFANDKSGRALATAARPAACQCSATRLSTGDNFPGAAAGIIANCDCSGRQCVMSWVATGGAGTALTCKD